VIAMLAATVAAIIVMLSFLAMFLSIRLSLPEGRLVEAQTAGSARMALFRQEHEVAPIGSLNRKPGGNALATGS
jgi:hypothetical protein